MSVLFAGCPGDPWEPEPPCEAGAWYADGDGDGVGDGGVAVVACVAPARHVAEAGDCDDADASVFPGAVEACNGVDDDCDGKVDEDDDPVAFYADADGDGWGVDGDVEYAPCGPPPGYAAEPGDCDDDDPRVHPGADDEPCDGLDRDCDGHGEGLAAAALGAAEFDEIQDAIDAAVDGDAVYVCPGRHVVRLEVPAMELTLGSWSGDPEDTVLDGEHLHPMLLIDDDARVTVEHLGFEHGRADERSCADRWDGGAIRSYGERLALTGCVFRANSVDFDPPGAGVHGAAVSALRCHKERLQVEVSDCVFEQNGCNDDESGTDAVLEVSCSGTPMPEDCVVDATVVDSVFRYNLGTNAGVSIEGWGTPHARVQRCEFTGNVIENDSNSGILLDVGTVHRIAGSAVVEDCRFVGNRSRCVSLGAEENRLERGEFVDNEAGGGGTALSMTGGDVFDSVFQGNRTIEDDGGAVSINDAHVRFERCLFVDNVADGYGGALDLAARHDDAHIEIVDSVIEGNAAVDGGGIRATEWGAHPLLVSIEGGAVRGNDGGGLLFHRSMRGGTLESVDVDWGSDASDNVPYDVDTNAWFYDDMVDGESFTCEGGGACHAP